MINKENIVGYLLLGMIFFICIKIYKDNDFFQLKCVISDVNGKKYCVRERKNIEKATGLLAKTTLKLEKLVKHLNEKYPDKENVQRLVKKFNPEKIKEILPNSEYTAYSENKGEKIAFCLSSESKDDLSNMIDENTLMFVALHEISHVASKTIGHNDEFWSNFKFILKEANKLNIYVPIDYSKNNQHYCGMKIKDNPFFS